MEGVGWVGRRGGPGRGRRLGKGGSELVGWVDFRTEGIIRERESAEVATGKDMEGGEMEGRRDTVVEARQRARISEERMDDGVGGVKFTRDITEAEMFQEEEEVGERDEIIQEPRGGGEADTEGEAECVALEDLEGLVEGRGGGDPCGTAEAEDGTDERFVRMEDGGGIQAPGLATEEFQEAEAVVSFGLDGAEVWGPGEVAVEGEA